MDVEHLRLHTGRVHHLPFQVVAGELGVGNGLGFFSHRLDGLGPVDGLLGAGDIGESGVAKCQRRARRVGGS